MKAYKSVILKIIDKDIDMTKAHKSKSTVKLLRTNKITILTGTLQFILETVM